MILGLLLLRSMTIYEIRGFISKNLNSMCSDSMGGIQAALKKLLLIKAITYEEYMEKGVSKKRYCITERGVDTFKEWIEQPIQYGKAKDIEESKFFFMGIEKQETRIKLLEEHIKNLKQEKEKMLDIQNALEEGKRDVIEQNVERICKDSQLYHNILRVSEDKELKNTVASIYRYQLFTLEYGLESLSRDIAFFERILTREKEGV